MCSAFVELVMSPWAKQNYVDSTYTDQTSALRFIEDNWNLGRIGDQSYDADAGSITGMFDFDPAHARAPKMLLDPGTGTVVGSPPSGLTVAPPGAPAFTTTATPAVAATAIASAAPTATGTAPPAGTPGPAAAAKPAVSCKAALKKGRVAVTCKERGLLAGAGKITLKLTLLKGRRTAGTGSGTVVGGRSAFKVKPRGRTALARGRYTLKVKVTQAGQSTRLTGKLKVK